MLKELSVRSRRLVAGAVGEQVSFPQAPLGAGVFIPVTGVAGEGDDDHVGPAVAVEVVAEAAEGIAVHGLREDAIGPQDVAFPFAIRFLGRLVPAIADDDVGLAVLVDVNDADPFGAKILVERDFLPGDLARLIVLGRGVSAVDCPGQQESEREPAAAFHASPSEAFHRLGNSSDYGGRARFLQELINFKC